MSVVKQKVLMNEEYFAEYSLLPINYSYTEIFNYLKLAEQMHIMPIIGIDLYNELLDQVAENKVTPANASLLLAIYPYLGAAVVEVAMPMLAYRVNEAGITKNSSENSQPLTIEELNYLTNYIKSHMTVLKDQLINFIELHRSDFPSIPEFDCYSENKNNTIYSLGQINTDIDHNHLYNRPFSSINLNNCGNCLGY